MEIVENLTKHSSKFTTLCCELHILCDYYIFNAQIDNENCCSFTFVACTCSSQNRTCDGKVDMWILAEPETRPFVFARHGILVLQNIRKAGKQESRSHTTLLNHFIITTFVMDK